MRSFQVSVSVPANNTVKDAITAAGFNAYFGQAANVTFYSNAAAAGLTEDMNADDGQEAAIKIPTGSTVGVASTVGKIKTNEDFVTQFAIASGFKLLWNLQNSTGAAIIAQGLFVIT